MEMIKPPLYLFKIILISVFLQLIAFPNSVIPRSQNSNDEKILKSIMNQWSSQGQPFFLHSWYNSTISPCSWFVVECTKGNIVTGIFLNEQNITGEIPASICNLKNLTYLDLGNNYITGHFPTFLYNCTNLQFLILYGNSLDGKLPNDIDNLSPKLQYLDLWRNHFSGHIPSSVGMLKGLVTLYLGYNLLNGTIPSELGNLENLKILHLGRNNLVGEVPSGLFLLNNLTLLYLNQNQLSGGLPGPIKAMNLMHINFSMNNMNGTIPRDIGNLSNLLFLSLQGNQFSGSIPVELTTLSKIEELRLDNNQLSGELPSIRTSWKLLYMLNISNNNISGSLPAAFGSLPYLHFLDLSNNKLSGNIPKEEVNFKNLGYLDLSNNKMSGELPLNYLHFPNLYYLNLSNNKLSGKIPPYPKYMFLPNLEFLDLSNNKLSGKLPHEYLNFPNLQCLNLSNNMLKGQLPQKDIYLSKYSYLDVSNNHLSGKVPALLDDATQKYHRFSNNNLCSNLQTSNLPRCSSLHPFRYLLFFLLPGSIILLVSLYIVLRKRKHLVQQPQPPEWTMTPFHNINFTESNIVSCLIEDNVIGSGGSGKIYLVNVNDSSNKVAVKRMWENKKMSHALEKQIMAEAEILGKIRHVNIVKLLCFISKEGSKLLVYEYMENHSLDVWLHRKQNTQGSSASRSLLDWPTRLNIAIGAAKGLSYMHHACSPPVIHRDVKSSNILLDSEFNAKIADFGLAKMSPEYKIGEPHTASGVAGSFGYIAPEYWRTRRVSEKIDMYSFGVVLLELVTGKEACKGNDHLNLAEWSWKHHIQGHPMEDILDGDIKDPSNLREMMNVLKVGLMCTSIVPSSRPSMKQVVKMLTEYSWNEAYERTTQIDNDEEPINILIGDNVMSP